MQPKMLLGLSSLLSVGFLRAVEGAEKDSWRVLGNKSFESGARRNLIWQDGFESGGWRAGLNSGSSAGSVQSGPLWNQSMNQGDYSARAIQAIDESGAQAAARPAAQAAAKPRAGRYAMRFEWKRDNYNGSNVSKKATLFTGREPSCREERWWSWSLLLPSQGMEKDKEAEILAQWHSTPDQGEAWTNPPLSLSNSNGQGSISWLHDTRAITPKGWKWKDRSSVQIGALPLDRWIDWVWHIKWDPWGHGLLQVWMDGRQLVDEKDIAIGFNDQVGNYLGLGLYKYSGKSQHERRVLFVDEVRGGNAKATYKDVAPSKP